LDRVGRLDDAQTPVLVQMASVRAGRPPVIAVQNVGREETKRYGIVKTESASRSPHRIGGIVEKPTSTRRPGR
jgi:UTP--glucose-1-phosphate uridylyltransferase